MTDTRIDTKNQPARKECLCCKKKFTPDPHVGQRQTYCSDKQCQAKRLRLTKDAWLKKEENKKFRKAQQSRWRRRHPEHLKQWRKKNPSSVRRNRESTRGCTLSKAWTKEYARKQIQSGSLRLPQGRLYKVLGVP